MNPRDQKLFLRIINDHISDAEKTLQHQLPAHDREILISICERFVFDAIAKYVRGSKEHGGCVTDHPALPELGNEILDLVIYFHAHKLQMKGMLS